jgi:hypothetical protein
MSKTIDMVHDPVADYRTTYPFEWVGKDSGQAGTT